MRIIFPRCLGMAVALTLTACGDDLGPCDEAAADELVYGRNGLVATKGQALAHDSCGNGVFCHSSAARGNERHGAPAGMNFDMLPAPRGVSDMLQHVDSAWSLVAESTMPPSRVGHRVLGDGEWSVDVQRDVTAPQLASINTAESRGVFRNWLACGAPVVVETQVPKWARPAVDPFAGAETPEWQDIYDVILQPQCALSGCHTTQSAAGELTLSDPCSAFSALFSRGACGEPEVIAGNSADSLLMNKLTAAEPRCGGPMPPIGTLPPSFADAIARWIDAGAAASGCP